MTLCNIFISSRQLCEIVEPFVYARIVFPASYSSELKVTRLESLIEALEASDGRRAPYVRALSFAAISSRTREPELIDQILAKTVNLKSLKLYTLSGSSLQGHSFQQNPVFALTTLHASSTLLHKDQDLLDFLESQRSLETLHLTRSRHHENKPEFSATSFPNLKTLFVHNTSLIHPFLRTAARLERLCIMGRAYWPNSSPGNTIHTDSVRTLSCLRLLSPQVALSLASLFPNLEWLSGPITTVNLDDLCRRNGNLRGILLTGLPYTDFPQDEATQFFDTMPRLQFVEYSTSRNNHHRWYRGAAEPTQVRWLCELGKEWLADWIEDVVHIER
ncbi:hypothetical protein EYR40_003149 [Pleurotus pulmonarius]|nr:hypothetical protein EYR40_003149 [Pleurotus pulmonarius]